MCTHVTYFLWRNKTPIMWIISLIWSYVKYQEKNIWDRQKLLLTLVLLNPDSPVIANSVDADQLGSAN